MFVIERVDELGDEAANRMLKTLEEPASFVHLILLTDRLAEVLPTIRSRCQVVRFDAPTVRETAAALEALGERSDTALACARLALGDAERARELAGDEGQALRAAAERFARAAIAGEMARTSRGRSCSGRCARAGRRRGPSSRRGTRGARAVSAQGAQADRDRVEGADQASAAAGRDRGARPRAAARRALVPRPRCLAWEARDLVRNVDRWRSSTDSGVDPQRLRAAIELVEDTRQRFQLNVSEELACEALAYHLERLLAA